MCVLLFLFLLFPLYLSIYRAVVLCVCVYDFYRCGIKNNGETVVFVVDVFVNLMLSSDRLQLLPLLMSHSHIHVHFAEYSLLMLNV